MSKHFESGSSKHSKVTKVAATTVSACVVAGALLVMAFIPGRQLSFGNANPANASVVQEVSPKVSTSIVRRRWGWRIRVLTETGNSKLAWGIWLQVHGMRPSVRFSTHRFPHWATIRNPRCCRTTVG